MLKRKLARMLDTAFSPPQVFRFGQDVGWAWWFDDPTTAVGTPYAYQDGAGTTPVTAVGQTLGLVLDRAYGGIDGASLLANGATGLTGTATAASYSTTTFAGSVSRAGDASNQSWVTWTGLTTDRVFRIRITNTGATSLDVRNGGVAGTIVASIAAGATSWVHPSTLSASTSITITATTNSTTATFTLSQFNLVPGTHRIQATSTARPLLMARVNLFLASEIFTNGAWTALGTAPTVTENVGTAPNDTLTADRIQLAAADSRLRQNATLNTGASYILSKWVKSNTGGTQTFRLWGADGAAISSNLTATTFWQLFKFTFTNAGATAGYSNGIRTDSSSTAADLLVWGADLRTTDDAAKNIPAYQRVGATAADHDTAGFPHHDTVDGTDDSLTSTTGGGNTTGFFYCGVLTVLGGAGAARTIWSDTGTNTGYRVRINSSNKLELAAGNGSAYTTVQSNETITAPGTYILSAWDDGSSLAVQVNNYTPATTARPAVSAGTSTITAYKDNGAASSFFTGRDYGSVYRQSYPGATMHDRLKRWLANQARLIV